MKHSKRIICVIPARLHSTRFPKKVLALLGDKPLMQWAYEGALRCSLFDEVLLAVDAEETYRVAKRFTDDICMTSSKCSSGTERLIEVMQEKNKQADIWVNWQADEPFIQISMIEDLLQTVDDERVDIWTLQRKIASEAELQTPHVVKVVTDYYSRALYFSRSVIPHSGPIAYKHIGIYAYTAHALRKITFLPECDLEKQEKLEQLRFLYHGMHIRLHETDKETLGIDTKEELKAAELLLLGNHTRI